MNKNDSYDDLERNFTKYLSQLQRVRMINGNHLFKPVIGSNGFEVYYPAPHVMTVVKVIGCVVVSFATLSIINKRVGELEFELSYATKSSYRNRGYASDTVRVAMALNSNLAHNRGIREFAVSTLVHKENEYSNKIASKVFCCEPVVEDMHRYSVLFNLSN